MWWKITSVILLVYTFTVGMLVPLRPGILNVTPESGSTRQTTVITISGYNAHFMQGQGQTRVWLTYDDENAIMAHRVNALSDTLLEAEFQLPANLPKGEAAMVLNCIVDNPADGTSVLPNAFQLKLDSTTTSATDPAWTSSPVEKLNVKRGSTYPYRNVIYETIRNTYFHVPMWFALIFLLIASAWNSLKYLRDPKPEYDRRASSYAEAGLLYGLMGLVTGMLWAHYAWGKAWSNDIKQITTAVALLIYMAYFILRSSFDEPEKGARLSAVYNIFAFATLIPLLYIVPRMFASLHPGATGSPAFGGQDLDNTMRAVFYPSILGWTLLGFWITSLRIRAKRIEDKLGGLD